MNWLRHAGLIAILTIVAPACDTFPADRALGVSLDSDGTSIVIKYVACGNDVVKSVRLFRNNDDDSFIGDQGDELLWEVTAAAGATAESFVVGRTPGGFTEETPFVASLTADAPLGVLLDTTKVQAGVRFKLSDLITNRVFSNGDSLDPAAWETKARGRCR